MVVKLNYVLLHFKTGNGPVPEKLHSGTEPYRFPVESLLKLDLCTCLFELLLDAFGLVFSNCLFDDTWC